MYLNTYLSFYAVGGSGLTMQKLTERIRYRKYDPKAIWIVTGLAGTILMIFWCTHTPLTLKEYYQRQLHAVHGAQLQ